MNAPITDWATKNQHALMSEVAAVRELLQAQPNDTLSSSETPCAALDSLCAAFGLSQFERRLLLLCAGAELDGSFAAQCASAPSSNGKPSPTFALALAAIPDAHWDALSHQSPLRYWHLLELAGDAPLVARQLRIDERILFFLSGVQEIDQRLVRLIEPLRLAYEVAESQRPALQSLEAEWRSAFAIGKTLPVLQLCGADPGAKRTLAAAVTDRLAMRLFRLRASLLPANFDELEMLHRLWEREAILQHAALLLECDDDEIDDRSREAAIDHWIERSHTALIVSARVPRVRKDCAHFNIEVRKPTGAEQRLAWQHAIGERAQTLNGQLDRLVAQFDFSTDVIRATADSLGTKSDAELWDACRLRARPRLQDLAQQIVSRATWDDLVMPAPQLATLRAIARQVRQRTRVHDEWGFAEKSSRGLALSALFAGPSGTGKTLAAEILANELRLDLFRIDLSAVVSKYIGETEKNLRRVFDAAEEGGAVLLFDEADALFGKRSEVKDSHDRYANVEISYLLQRIEPYRGLAILTTNMKEALDPAFLRRLRFVVQFPFPDQVQRAEIWRRIFPAKAPTEQLDLSQLSRLTIAGGNIRSIALNAAFAAADASEPIRMNHLLGAARLEYEKLEKPLTSAELGGWR